MSSDVTRALERWQGRITPTDRTQWCPTRNHRGDDVWVRNAALGIVEHETDGVAYKLP